jgi:Holliday junction resolvase RusA-like endonuclease
MSDITREFSLAGKIPSKKNSKMIARGRIITKPQYQVYLASVVWQCKSIWVGSPPLTNCDVDLLFFISNSRQDLDNMQSSLLDCLKIARVISDDSTRHVRRISSSIERVPRGQEGVRVRITGTPEQ